ncbi:PREDICTED: endochitinase 2-like, partial [Rhagoletis zephyria]
RSDFYDEDVFINPDGTELPDDGHSGVDNAHMVANHHALRSRDNIYEYRDSPSFKTLGSKIHIETTLIRSPSSLAMTHKPGSQSSLKSAISLKETNDGTLSSTYSSTRPSRLGTINNSATPTTQKPKSVEEKRLLTCEPPTPISSAPLIATTTTTISETPGLTSSKLKAAPTGTMSSRSTTPVPSARNYPHTTTATISSAPQLQRSLLPPTSATQEASQPHARTQVIEGVPQTSV